VTDPPSSASGSLKRELGVFGAMMTGLGSIIGTGVFVSIGVAAGVAGPAVILAIAIAALLATCIALTAIGSVKTTWAFSAFTVLIYYAITNLAALRLKEQDRLYSPAFAWAGLAGCLLLASWVDWPIWLTGLGLIAAGLTWHTLRRRGAKAPRW